MNDEDLDLARKARDFRARIERNARTGYVPQYKPTGLNPYFQSYLHILHEIDDVLERYLGVPLYCNEARFGASLIYSHADGPIWRLGKNKQGKTETRIAIQALWDAERVLKEEADVVGNQQVPADHRHFRTNLAAYLREIPEPGNLLFDIDLFGLDRRILLQTIQSYRHLLQGQAASQKSGNAGAFRTALALRAVYEHYLKERIKPGKDEHSQPTGTYSKCLAEIYEVIGLEAEVYSKGCWARDRPETDPILCSYRGALSENSAYDEAQPYLFSKVGWVENVTPAQKEINSIAMNDERLEYQLCYTKCSMEQDSTTMKTKS